MENLVQLMFDVADICPGNNGGLEPLLGLLGYVIILFKIVVPILLIIFGMLDVGKSVVAGKPDEVTKNLKSFAMRAVAAVLVFFIPSIVGVIMSAVGDASKDPSTAKGWEQCKSALKL